MTVTAQAAGTDVWLRRFPEFLKESESAGDPHWLVELRQEAMARFASAGVPTTREEDWRGTNLSPVARTDWTPATCDGVGPLAKRVEQEAALGGVGPLLVLVNGRFSAEMSDLSGLSEGVILTGLAQALAERPRDVRATMEAAAEAGGHVLGDLNMAFLQDGLFLSLPAGKVISTPIRVVSIHSGGTTPTAIQPRLVVCAGEGSQATLVEIHAGGGGSPRLANVVVDMVLHQGAVLAHVKLENEEAGGTHIGLTRVRLDRDSNYDSLSISTGADLTRNDLLVLLAGQGAQCRLNGLYPVNGSRHVDNHTVIDHASPHTSSTQLYKGILDDRGQGVFYGRVVVRPDAQKVVARQTNNNLILSDGAQAQSTPQLEIHADDVQCFHGSTIGQLDEEMIFYLRSRGIAGDRARQVLTVAFANAILEQVPVTALRKVLARKLFPEAQL
ncbi:MAG: Fe-S cluster assembly protein SufD [Acidobacteria bacterium]|nr:Fe-S cluster assembly protein SufD [Acidobacteriota bacterium]